MVGGDSYVKGLQSHGAWCKRRSSRVCPPAPLHHAQYKYVIINYETKQALEWQSGSNAVLAVVVDEARVEVFDNWCVLNSAGGAARAWCSLRRTLGCCWLTCDQEGAACRLLPLNGGPEPLRGLRLPPACLC